MTQTCENCKILRNVQMPNENSEGCPPTGVCAVDGVRRSVFTQCPHSLITLNTLGFDLNHERRLRFNAFMDGWLRFKAFMDGDGWII